VKTGAMFLMMVGVLFAQNSGTISGTVFDLAGNMIANIPIQVTNVASKALYKTISSSQGEYAFASLPAGIYDLSIVRVDFDPYVRQGVNVRAGDTLRIDIHLVDFQLNTLGDGRAEAIQWFTEHKVPRGPAPRMNGKPDFSGVWHGARIVDPGKPEMMPWAAAAFNERTDNHQKDQPFSRCLPAAPLDTTFSLKFVQTPRLLVIIHPANLPRQIFLDGRGHPKDLYPTWGGHSIGRWEGDTLVVDTVCLNDQQWIDFEGHPRTEQMHMIERFRRPDLGHLEIDMTFDDTGAYSKPWSIKAVSDLAQGEELDEYICTENNRDPQHMVGK
jgi:hypothetical protein